VYNVRFSMTQEMKEMVDRLAEVLGVSNPEKNLARIFKRALEISLDEKDPRRKLAKREARDARKAARDIAKKSGEADALKKRASKSAAKSRPDEANPSRHVPVATRELVYARAGYQCEYRGVDGVRCCQRTQLSIDHCGVPYARGGTHDESNLRVLCMSHNLWCARELYGKDVIERKIQEARERRRIAKERIKVSGRFLPVPTLRWSQLVHGKKRPDPFILADLPHYAPGALSPHHPRRRLRQHSLSRRRG